MLQTVIFALITLIIVLFLKNHHPEYAMLASAAAGVILLVTVILQIYRPIEALFEKLEGFGVDSALIVYLLKVFGVCYITKFASELCSDFGQTSLSAKVELAGRAAVFVLTLPLIESVLELAISFI